MDRQIVYAGSIPLDTDLLHIQRHVLTSIGALAHAVLGDAAVVDGMACAPAAQPYSVTVGPGSCIALAPIDGAPFGSLGTDPASVMQTGLHVANSVVTLGQPPDVDHVVCWLVQAAVEGLDSGPVALPYWNAANPAVPFSGPGNSGAAQNTQRLLRVVLSAKPNAPQLWPIGTPPEPDPGWIGLYAVTTVFAKPGIEARDIVPYWGAPRIRFPLPALPPGPSQQLVFHATGQWQAPDNVRLVRARVVGAGGGGGGGDSSFSGGGGGAGGYAEGFVQVRPRQYYDVVVGFGGGAGVSGESGEAGGGSYFASQVQASGGLGGGSGNPDSHGGSPGQGVLGSLLQAGGYGGDGAPITKVPGGNGGASTFGGGGRGADEGGLPAIGLAAGSGGGGGYDTGSTGGAGANGIVIVEF